MRKNHLQHKKILIIEDDVQVLEVVDQSLVQAGFVTERAQSGEEAFQKMDLFLPDLVLSDHDMPKMSGLEFLIQLRKKKNYVSVIFMSGRSDLKTVCQSLELGADDYLRKPFRFEELIARVRSSLRTQEVHVQLQLANEKLQEMVDHDFLTGLYNMRTMYDKIDFELKRSRRYQRPMAIVMLDMDHFKTVNDQNDHLFGSYVLSEMGKILKNSVRSTDYASRYGGDEFLIVLTEVNSDGAKTFCERLRSKVEKHVFANESSQISLTLSLGFTVFDGKNNFQTNARQIVRCADHALYRAKENGRNRFFEGLLSEIGN